MSRNRREPGLQLEHLETNVIPDWLDRQVVRDASVRCSLRFTFHADVVDVKSLDPTVLTIGPILRRVEISDTPTQCGCQTELACTYRQRSGAYMQIHTSEYPHQVSSNRQ